MLPVQDFYIAKRRVLGVVCRCSAQQLADEVATRVVVNVVVYEAVARVQV